MPQEYMIPQKRKSNVMKATKSEPTFVQEVIEVMKNEGDTKLPDFDSSKYLPDYMLAEKYLYNHIINSGIDKDMIKFYSDPKNKFGRYRVELGGKVFYLQPRFDGNEEGNLPIIFDIISERHEKESPLTIIPSLLPKFILDKKNQKQSLTTEQGNPPVIDKPKQPEDGGVKKPYLDVYDLSVPSAEALSRRVKFVPEPKNWRDALWSGANLASGAILEGGVNLIRENVAREVAKKALEAYAKSSDLTKEQANINQQLSDITKQLKETEDVNKQQELQKKKAELESRNKLIQRQLDLANEVVPKFNKEKAEIAIKMADLERKLQEARTNEEYKQALIELQKEKQRLQDAWKRLEIEAKKQSGGKTSLGVDDLVNILEKSK